MRTDMQDSNCEQPPQPEEEGRAEQKDREHLPSGAHYNLTFVLWLSLKALSLSGVTKLPQQSLPDRTALLKRHLELHYGKCGLQCVCSKEFPI